MTASNRLPQDPQATALNMRVTQDDERFKDFLPQHVPPFHHQGAWRHRLSGFLRRKTRPKLKSVKSCCCENAPNPVFSFRVYDHLRARRAASLVRGCARWQHGLCAEGVLGRHVYFCFEHLHKKGFTHVNMGGSRPFLRDGVLTFKRKYSQVITAGRWEGFSLKILSLTPAAKTFLMNNRSSFSRTDGCRERLSPKRC